CDPNRFVLPDYLGRANLSRFAVLIRFAGNEGFINSICEPANVDGIVVLGWHKQATRLIPLIFDDEEDSAYRSNECAGPRYSIDCGSVSALVQMRDAYDGNPTPACHISE